MKDESNVNKVRIYGIDPGLLKENEDKAKNLSEVDLYLTIDSLGGHIWYCQHAMSHDRIEKVDLTEEIYTLEYLVYQTRKFGVEIPDAIENKHVQRTASYDAWYSFYANHFKNVLSDQEWNAFMAARQMGEDISRFLPEGSWKETNKEGKVRKLNK